MRASGFSIYCDEALGTVTNKPVSATDRSVNYLTREVRHPKQLIQCHMPPVPLLTCYQQLYLIFRSPTAFCDHNGCKVDYFIQERRSKITASPARKYGSLCGIANTRPSYPCRTRNSDWVPFSDTVSGPHATLPSFSGGESCAVFRHNRRRGKQCIRILAGRQISRP